MANLCKQQSRMWKDMTYRSKEIEIMDDLDMSGDLLISTLDRIAQINTWLGGNKLTLQGVDALLRGKDKSKIYTILDLGCGNGDMLRALAEYGKENNYNFTLVGIDANATTIEYAKKLSLDYKEISFRQLDIFSEAFNELNFDIALSTLFLHHFDNEAAQSLVDQWTERSTIGVVINDLHRHPIAYYLFKIIASIIGNHMVKTDGLISILRGFKKTELQKFAKNIHHSSSIQWRWAFRYQWIINKI